MILIHLKITKDKSSELESIALISQDHTGAILGSFQARVCDYHNNYDFLAEIISDLCEHVDCYICTDSDLETVRSFVADQSRIMPGSSDDRNHVDTWDLMLSDESKQPIEAAFAAIAYLKDQGVMQVITKAENR